MHGCHLVVTDDVTPFDSIVFFDALMRDVAQEDDAVTCLWVDDDVFLCLTPGLEHRAIHGVKVLGFERMSAFDELQVSIEITL